MELQRLLSYTRRAVDEYHMIHGHERIAVGLSGGKDSMALITALSALSKFYPQKFEVLGVTVNLGFESLDTKKIEQYCNKLGVPYHVVDTDIYKIVFKERKEQNPCSLCSKMRKGALNKAVNKLGCSVVAYAHHKGDFVESFMMSLFFEGRLHSFSPVTYLDRSKITVIRPFIYVNEADLTGFINKYEIPVVKNPCPADGYTKREYVKTMLKELNRDRKDISDHIFTAILKDCDYLSKSI